MQLSSAEHCCLLQREEVAGGSQVGKCTVFNNAQLLQSGLWGQRLTNIYLPYGSSQDTPLHITATGCAFPLLSKNRFGTNCVELQVAQMQCIIFYLATRRV